MSKVLTSIGVEFYIGWSSSYNELPPKTQWRKIPQVIANSEFDLEPEAVSTRSFNNLRYRTYVADAIDTGGVQSLTVNLTKDRDAETVWDEMVELYENGEFIWMCPFIPQTPKSAYIPIAPVPIGANNISLNDRLTTKLYYTVVGDFELRETIKPFWNSSTWTHLQFLNGGNQLTSQSEIDVDDINMLFNNVFYLKGT